MSEFIPNVSEVELRAAIAEDAFRPDGVAYDIAQGALERPTYLNPDDAGDVIMPPRQPGEAKQARWELIEGSKDAVKAGATERADDIFDLADRLDMRRDESVSEQDIAKVDPLNSLLVVEPGANKTAVVRRAVANEVAQRLHGANAAYVTVHQFGTDRAIPREKNGKENPEYKVARQIAGDHLPDTDDLTEFGLNLASALQDGYRVVDDVAGAEFAQRQVKLQKEGMPLLEVIQPYKETGKLDDAFTALRRRYNLADAQFVIATNGQYRPKDELQADQWARQNGVNMQPPVAVGDEAGYRAPHDGQEFETAPRGAAAYLNEVVILHRLSDKADWRA